MKRQPAALALFALLSACGGGLVNTKSDDTGDAVDGTPNLYVEVNFVDFGAVELAQVETANLTIRNTGTGDLEVSPPVFTNNVFGTSGIPSIIPAGGNAVVNLTFLPTDYGVYDGTLSIITNDPDANEVAVSLRGRVIADADGDGFESEAAGGDDCDDNDPEINPDAEDIWYDGKDSNCDGADDYDQDGDGYQTAVWNADAATGGGDCQDNNPDMYPGAPDAWYDGVDSDCDGSNDYDRDGDGFSHPAGGGSDCDDDNPLINPDGVELMDGSDNDCDGVIDNDVVATNATRTYRGAAAGDHFGSSLTMGDTDGDGRDDLIVGAYGYASGRGGVAIFDGTSMPADRADIEDGANYFRGDGAADNLGWYVGYLSSYGSGDPHVAVGAPGANGNYGAMYLIPASDARTGGDIGDAVTIVTGGSSAYWVGRAMAQDLDLDGDGLEDLFGFYTTSASNTATPYMWLLYGDATGSFSVAGTVDARFAVSGNAQIVQTNQPNGGDLDGDGYDDTVYCDHFADLGATNNGGVWALWGSSAQYSNSSATSLSTAGTLVDSGDNYERLGWQCAIGPDLDGDGAGELWAFNPGTSYLYVVPGGIDMRSGSIEADVDYSHRYMIRSNNPWPDALRSIGDMDGDGIDEMAAGLRSPPNTTGNGGQVWVFSSQDAPGTYTSADAVAVEGDTELGNVLYGARLSGRPGDLNGDGYADFVASDHGFDVLSSTGTVTSDAIGAVFITYSAR